MDPLGSHASPHDIDPDGDHFPVADTDIGRIGVAICYDWLFPETIRQLAFNGAEVLVRVSAYMDPWGATERWIGGPSSIGPLRSRIRRMSWRPIKA